MYYLDRLEINRTYIVLSGGNNVAIEIKNVSVSFAGLKVLKNVNMKVNKSVIHGVLGANGSGKSTLIKVLTGIYHPDKDANTSIIIDGTERSDILSPAMAYDLGVRAVHQESPLINEFTVAECIASFKGYPKKYGKIDWKNVRKNAENLLQVYGIKISPETIVSELSAAQRNMVAIAIAIGHKEELKHTKLLILDEAEASIPASETEFFLKHLRGVAKRGIPIIMITHRLKEVMKYCDEITILNDGEIVFSDKINNVSEDIIVSNMTNNRVESIKAGIEEEKEETLEELWQMLNKQSTIKDGQTVLKMSGVKGSTIKGLDFSLKAGEILGIIGVSDSGVSELPLILSGEIQRSKGEYIVNNKKLPRKLTSKTLLKNGIGVLPRDRSVRGGITSCTLKENILMPNEKQYWHKKKLAKRMMDLSQRLFDIHPYNSSEKHFQTFSGGNQQKAIMAKWLSLRPIVFVLDDPTYGVDPTSRKKMFDLLKEAAALNVGIIVFSTEPEQLANICTRIIVLKEGKVSGQIDQQDGILDREIITRSYLW